jgi:hypothetical protein
MSGLDKVKSTSSEPVSTPILQSEDIYVQTTTTRNLVVKESATFPENYINDSIDSYVPHAFLLMGA